MVLEKAAHLAQRTGDQRIRAALREPGRVNLLVDVPQGRRAVDHHCTALGRTFQNIGAVDVLGVEGRVLAHQDDVQLAQVNVRQWLEPIPVIAAVAHCEPARRAQCFTIRQAQIFLLEVVQLPAARLGLQQHGQAAVFVRRDRPDRVHHDAEADRLHAALRGGLDEHHILPLPC